MIQRRSTQRSIPACAGEPDVPTWDTSPTIAVYPRVCGGTTPRPLSTRSARGLSPRVRGNPSGVFPQHPKHEVYPRVCGGTFSLLASNIMT